MTAKTTGGGLRERKKLATREAISTTALHLFAERGFDAVTVADVAAAATVAEKTVYNYFPTKEALVFAYGDALDGDLLAAVRARGRGESIAAVVRRHTLAVARRVQAIPPKRRTAFRAVIRATPSLRAHWRELLSRHEADLARLVAAETDAHGDDIVPYLAASVLGIARRLAFCNLTGWPTAKHKSAAELESDIHAAFDLLDRSLGALGVRR